MIDRYDCRFLEALHLQLIVDFRRGRQHRSSACPNANPSSTGILTKKRIDVWDRDPRQFEERKEIFDTGEEGWEEEDGRVAEEEEDERAAEEEEKEEIDEDKGSFGVVESDDQGREVMVDDEDGEVIEVMVGFVGGEVVVVMVDDEDGEVIEAMVGYVGGEVIEETVADENVEVRAEMDEAVD